jgi:flavin reductase (DIM6/NTAB) family NADH-FMN oxidoreductase RutF
VTSRGATQTVQAPGIQPPTFRETMGSFATGVTIITTAHRGEPYGMTANSFSALSLEPCLVLMCIGNRSRARRLIDHSSAFSANVLGSDQEGLSRRFAEQGRPLGAETFDVVPFGWGATGCPVIVGAIAHVDCRVVDLFPGGDHTIVVGEVVAMDCSPDPDPLVFYRGRYRNLRDQRI